MSYTAALYQLLAVGFKPNAPLRHMVAHLAVRIAFEAASQSTMALAYFAPIWVKPAEKIRVPFSLRSRGFYPPTNNKRPLTLY